MRTSADEPMPVLAKNPLNGEIYIDDRAYLPKNFRVTPPLQDRLNRIYYEARRRATAAQQAASMSAGVQR